MQESVSAALSYVRSRSTSFGIKPTLFEKRDIHVHVPEGATPKDGPSAGVAMATSIVSVLTGIPVRRDVAMTGEITLRGRVLPIGGLKEKLLAALRAGITTVFIPKENEKDLAEIPDNVKKHLKIIPVADVDEVIAQALARRPEPIEWEEPPEPEPVVRAPGRGDGLAAAAALSADDLRLPLMSGMGRPARALVRRAASFRRHPQHGRPIDATEPAPLVSRRSPPTGMPASAAQSPPPSAVTTHCRRKQPVNKMELIAAVADSTDLSRAKATEVVDAVFGAIEGALKKKEEVRLVGFGTFATSASAATTGRNPAHRRGNADPRLHLGAVQGRQGAEGRCSVAVVRC